MVGKLIGAEAKAVEAHRKYDSLAQYLASYIIDSIHRTGLETYCSERNYQGLRGKQ